MIFEWSTASSVIIFEYNEAPLSVTSRNMYEEVILLSISSMLLRDWIPVGFMSNGVYHDVENYYTCDRHNVTSDYEKSLLSLQ